MKIERKVELLKQLETLTEFRKDEHKIEFCLKNRIFGQNFYFLKN